VKAAQAGLNSIQWQQNTGAGYVDIAGANSSTYIATTIGKYRYTAKDANNCTVTQCCVFDIVAGSCQVATFDRGDLPDITAGTAANDYQTKLANNGPSHKIIAGLRSLMAKPTDSPTLPPMAMVQMKMVLVD
jgi:hypothetical protein